ncbi:hypothetical protein U370_00815 [Anaplasma marginale str. Dawn]|uniref:Uncharacterized protein n=1 Tax=Anaplasma marginale (strain Florida) TaxID=320483 RepID=B9KHT1_ANAMF|nr:hypothetical protein [Anaplasma marginale]AAV86335.1 hypothetical protein AM219 [Anaplasma marginale str. St. Maries]ACM49043.1 Conserved hypothetical protein [Anaplasma marginale str. Florida]AGZ78612.1 hypothetical protein U128_00805 [Anaplasma marginale str. Gypsy Plains]AGZ79463.1 hypothetical protein U370_00815 [Anaplasma marginale str. Dawn]AXW83812.1 hypothetical protein CQZ76_00830 [Anaplasma marginale]
MTCTTKRIWGPISLLLVLFLCTPTTMLAEECVGLLNAMMGCNAYRCVARFHGGSITYEVLGVSNGSCRYAERDSSGFTLCRVSKDNFPAISNYLVQLLTKSSNMDVLAVSRLRAATCDFYRTKGNSFVKRGKELSDADVKDIERAIERKMRKDEVGEIRSMFFTESDLSKLDARESTK